MKKNVVYLLETPDGNYRIGIGTGRKDFLGNSMYEIDYGYVPMPHWLVIELGKL